MIKPQGKFTAYRDEILQRNKLSNQEAYEARKKPEPLLERHEKNHENSSEITHLLLTHIRNLSTNMKELSERVQESMRLFNREHIGKESFAHNESDIKDLLKAQTTIIVDQVIAEVAQKIGEKLSVHLTQMIHQEKKSSELLLNAINYHFHSLDQRYDKLDRSLLESIQKMDTKARSSFGLGSPDTSSVSPPHRRQAVAQQIKTSKPLGKMTDWIVTSGLTLVSNPAIILLLFVLCLAGWRISVIFQHKLTPDSARITIAQNSTKLVGEKESPELAHTSQDSMGITPAAAMKDMTDLENFLPKNREFAPLKAAVLTGDSLAIYEMGVRFLSGTGVKREPGLATRFFEKAVQYNSPFAAYQLASQYEKGTGVARNVEKSLILYEQAANAGHAKAMHNLGALLAAGGSGGKPDYEKAIEWFRKAADHGLKDSQYNLGLLLAHGLGGPQDHVEAYKWFELAGQQNDEESMKKRDMVAKKMSSTDLALARVRTSQWRPKVSPIAEAHEASVLLPWTTKNNLPVRKEMRSS